MRELIVAPGFQQNTLLLYPPDCLWGVSTLPKSENYSRTDSVMWLWDEGRHQLKYEWDLPLNGKPRGPILPIPPKALSETGFFMNKTDRGLAGGGGWRWIPRGLETFADLFMGSMLLISWPCTQLSPSHVQPHSVKVATNSGALGVSNRLLSTKDWQLLTVASIQVPPGSPKTSI